MSQGLEFSFLKGWGGWDEIDTGVLQFSDPEFRTDAGIPYEVIDKLYNSGGGTFTMDCQSSSIQVYDEEGNELMDAKVKLVLA